MIRGPASVLERVLFLLWILLFVGAGLVRESSAQTTLRPDALRLTPQLLLVEVPNVEGRGLAEAEKILVGARLKPGQVTRTPSRAKPETVIGQTPGGGEKARPGTSVDLVVAIPLREVAPEFTQVPKLIGRRADLVPTLLKRARLQPGQPQERASTDPAGTVIDQKPAAGQRVAIGTVVDYLVAVAPPPPRPELTEVPKLIGRGAELVPALLRRARLQPGRQQERTADQPAGTVIDQKPAAGQKVAIGTVVDYLVAVAPPSPQPEWTEVPNLIGRSADQLPALLKRARLQPGQPQERASSEPTGTVIEQKPNAGQKVPIGTAVDFLVAVEPPPPPPPPAKTEVPELLSQALEEAIARLTAARLVAGAVTEQPSDQPPLRILEQHPAAGAQVEVGSAVDLVVAVALPEPAAVTVPDLSARNLDEARGALEALGLALGVIGERPSDRAAGRVLEQSPAAGTSVAPGTAVSLVLASVPSQVVPWGKIAGGLVAVGGVGLLLLRVMRQPKPPGPTAGAFQVVPDLDSGQQELIAIESVGIAWEAELRPVSDAGSQSIEPQGQLVLEEKADDHDP